MNKEAHWEEVYQTRDPKQVSWYRPHLSESLRLIEACQLPPTANIVDMGGGASTLVDDLLARGFESLTVVDLSGAALQLAQCRLGDDAETVRWVQGDATSALLEANSIDLWHDRAVFHFLAEPAQRQAYIEQISRCVRPDRFVLIATFSHEGPQQCSGLPVVRYSPEDIKQAVGDDFVLIDAAHETHTTPWDTPQDFAYALMQRKP